MEEAENTLAGTINDLAKEGYDQQLVIINPETAKCGDEKFAPRELKIDKHKRFEGMTNPSDMSVLYAISRNGEKLGIITDTFDPKEETDVSLFVRNIPEDE